MHCQPAAIDSHAELGTVEHSRFLARSSTTCELLPKPARNKVPLGSILDLILSEQGVAKGLRVFS